MIFYLIKTMTLINISYKYFSHLKKLKNNAIVEGENITMIEKVIKANLKDNYYSKLCYWLTTSHIGKK